MELHTARLVAITQPTEEIIKELGVNSPEGLTAYVTRVSNPQNQSNSDIKGLLQYCCKHGHWSVLEIINMTIEIITTRDISAQMIRHRSFTWQETSLRYTTSQIYEQPYEIPELRFQHSKNKQKSLMWHELEETPVSQVHYDLLQTRMNYLMEEVYKLYQDLLSAGIAKECARRILPMSSVTKLYMTGNIRSFVFYIKARGSKDGKSQIEHQKVADSIEAIFQKQFPIIYEALF